MRTRWRRGEPGGLGAIVPDGMLILVFVADGATGAKYSCEGGGFSGWRVARVGAPLGQHAGHRVCAQSTTRFANTTQERAARSARRPQVWQRQVQRLDLLNFTFNRRNRTHFFAIQ